VKTSGVIVALLLAGCSNLTEGNGGVVSLEVRRPEPATVEVGDTIQLSAVALDRNGDTVDAAIVWRTADTTVAVDSVTGRVTGLVAGQTGRVQAAETSLVSQPITLTVIGAADTLAIPADTLVVIPEADGSSPIAAAVLSRSDTAATGFVPATGVTISFSIVDPVFADPATRTVELTGGVLADTLVTGADGTASPAVTVNRVAGKTAPGTVRVKVDARHRSGGPVTGSGGTVVILFQ
jgi:hypothetical protein